MPSTYSTKIESRNMPAGKLVVKPSTATRVIGEQNYKGSGVHSSLLGHLGIGHELVIYYPERFANLDSEVMDAIDLHLVSIYRLARNNVSHFRCRMLGLCGYEGIGPKLVHTKPLPGGLTPARVVAGPVLLPQNNFGTICASVAASEKAWLISDEVHVSMAYIKSQQTLAYITPDPEGRKWEPDDLTEWHNLYQSLKKFHWR